MNMYISVSVERYHGQSVCSKLQGTAAPDCHSNIFSNMFVKIRIHHLFNCIKLANEQRYIS